MAQKKYWLMKTEPSCFSFEDLTRAKQRTTSWEGVRNYQARNLMRDEFQIGDEALIYHSGIDEPAVVGVAQVSRAGYVDETALDPKHKHFDPKAKAKAISPWIMVDVKATHRFKVAVTRERLKAEPKLSKMMVLKKGARLSVQPVTPEEFRRIVAMGKAEAL